MTIWNETLRKIDNSVTPQKAAAFWHADPGSLKQINSINLVYRFETNGHGRYLRITCPSIRNHEELASSIDYHRHLHQHGVAICEPIPSKDNHYLEEITQDDLTYLARVANEVPGETLDFNSSDQVIYKAWGKTLGQLHKAAKVYEPADLFRFRSWRDLHEQADSYLASEDDEIKNEYRLIDLWLKAMMPSERNFGLTHGDHRFGNILYDGKQTYMIDFDEPIYHWFAADIARPFLDLCEQPFTIWRQKFEWFIEGYRAVYPMSDEQLKNIAWFMRMKNLYIYLWTKNVMLAEGVDSEQSLKKYRNRIKLIPRHLF